MWLVRAFPVVGFACPRDPFPTCPLAVASSSRLFLATVGACLRVLSLESLLSQ